MGTANPKAHDASRGGLDGIFYDQAVGGIRSGKWGAVRDVDDGFLFYQSHNPL